MTRFFFTIQTIAIVSVIMLMIVGVSGYIILNEVAKALEYRMVYNGYTCEDAIEDWKIFASENSGKGLNIRSPSCKKRYLKGMQDLTESKD